MFLLTFFSSDKPMALIEQIRKAGMKVSSKSLKCTV